MKNNQDWIEEIFTKFGVGVGYRPSEVFTKPAPTSYLTVNGQDATQAIKDKLDQDYVSKDKLADIERKAEQRGCNRGKSRGCSIAQLEKPLQVNPKSHTYQALQNKPNNKEIWFKKDLPSVLENLNNQEKELL